MKFNVNDKGVSLSAKDDVVDINISLSWDLLGNAAMGVKDFVTYLVEGDVPLKRIRPSESISKSPDILH